MYCKVIGLYNSMQQHVRAQFKLAMHQPVRSLFECAEYYYIIQV